MFFFTFSDHGQGQHDTKTASEVAEDFIWDEVTSDAIHHFTQRFYSKVIQNVVYKLICDISVMLFLDISTHVIHRFCRNFVM